MAAGDDDDDDRCKYTVENSSIACITISAINIFHPALYGAIIVYIPMSNVAYFNKKKQKSSLKQFDVCVCV